ncbi:DUF2294 domain-containing protein [Planomicrobium okeanokoites]|uniref:DUF2294 domain-containing protein n=1 Tax=Planomicrobium okeanokoites TaxID=244 RepID=UPI00248FBA8B|nr:Na-translocating system protein MpsC family protein [Planomicrobium okeanokoites]
MASEKTVQSEISGYISTLLRDHFGKGPTSVYVTIRKPFIVIHFRGFIAPMEAVLLKQKEWKRVLETRDLLINELEEDIKKNLWRMGQLDISEFHADWNLELETGLLIGVIDENVQENDFEWPAEIDRDTFEEKIETASERAEKTPSSIESYWLNDRTILVKRYGILVGIEKALISEGYAEILKLAKRPLERHLILESHPEKILKRNIKEVFLDWNFQDDIGYIVFLLEPPKKQ